MNKSYILTLFLIKVWWISSGRKVGITWTYKINERAESIISEEYKSNFWNQKLIMNSTSVLCYKHFKCGEWILWLSKFRVAICKLEIYNYIIFITGTNSIIRFISYKLNNLWCKNWISSFLCNFFLVACYDFLYVFIACLLNILLTFCYDMRR